MPPAPAPGPPLSICALVSPALGVFSLVLLAWEIILSTRPEEMTAQSVTELGVAVSASAGVMLGCLGLAWRAKPRVRRGLVPAWCGMALGFFVLLFLLTGTESLLLRVQGPARENKRQGAVAAVMGACDGTLAQCLREGRPFSCAQVEVHWSHHEERNVRLEDQAPDGCLIVVTELGSGEEIRVPWTPAP